MSKPPKEVVLRYLDRIPVYEQLCLAEAADLMGRQERLVASGVRQEPDPAIKARAENFREVAALMACLRDQMRLIRPLYER